MCCGSTALRSLLGRRDDAGRTRVARGALCRLPGVPGGVRRAGAHARVDGIAAPDRAGRRSGRADPGAREARQPRHGPHLGGRRPVGAGDRGGGAAPHRGHAGLAVAGARAGLADVRAARAGALAARARAGEPGARRVASAGGARASVVTVYAENTVNSVRRRSQVRQRLRTRVGSGVAVEEFVIVTTASVVVGAERLWVRTTNGLRAEAQLAGLDPVNNVA